MSRTGLTVKKGMQGASGSTGMGPGLLLTLTIALSVAPGRHGALSGLVKQGSELLA